VVGMVYTSCAYACPRMLMDMKRIEGELGGGADVGFVIVTIDPERDTPERLAEYARGARLDGDRWTLLTGGDDDVLELAALLGVQYRRMANGEFVHSNFLSILDRDGQVVHRQMGLGAEPAETLAVIRSLAG
jgi:protein SCO1